MRKQIPTLAPIRQQRRFLVPFPTLAHQRHRQHLTVTAFGLWPWASKQRRDLLPHIIDQHVYPQAKIVKTVYHFGVSRIGQVKFGDLSLPHPRDFVFQVRDLAQGPNCMLVASQALWASNRGEAIRDKGKLVRNGTDRGFDLFEAFLCIA
jgi:hypothetical protein